MTAVDDFISDGGSGEQKQSDDTATNVTRRTRKQTSKRKHADEDIQTLKKKARVHVKSVEQWNIVNRYGEKRLREWIENKEFEDMKGVENSVFDAVHNGLALLLDTVFMGEGLVDDEIRSDVTLRHALEMEGSELAQYLSNKARILFLSAVDVFNAKRKQTSIIKNDQDHSQEIHIEQMEDSVLGQPVPQPAAEEATAEEEEDI